MLQFGTDLKLKVKARISS